MPAFEQSRSDAAGPVAQIAGPVLRAPEAKGQMLVDPARELSQEASYSGRLLISCPDGPGIVSAIGGFLYERGANIISSGQYSTHPEHGSFFTRVTFFLDSLAEDRSQFEADSPSSPNAST